VITRISVCRRLQCRTAVKCLLRCQSANHFNGRRHHTQVIIKVLRCAGSRRLFCCWSRTPSFLIEATTLNGSSLPGQRVIQMTSVAGVMLRYLATDVDRLVVKAFVSPW